MPSDVLDLSDTESGQTYPKSLKGLVKHYTLQRVLKGKICFPFTRGYGCGARVGMEKGEEISVGAKIGTELVGITFGTKVTSNATWSYESKDCEFCEPEICYPNSTLKEWRCKSKILKWRAETIEREFQSDSFGELHKNCIPNDPRCKCQDSSSVITQSAIEGGFPQFFSSAHSVVISPVTFSQEQDSAPAGNKNGGLSRPEEVYQEASTLFSGSLFGTPKSNKVPKTLGVLEPTGCINWLYPSIRSTGQISLLSLNCSEYVDGTIGIRVGEVFPVLAATQSLPAARQTQVRLSLSIGNNEEVKEKDKTPAPRTDLFTMVWTEFSPEDLGIKKFEAGMKGQLEIRLMELNAPIVLSHLVQNIKIL